MGPNTRNRPPVTVRIDQHYIAYDLYFKTSYSMGDVIADKFVGSCGKKGAAGSVDVSTWNIRLSGRHSHCWKVNQVTPTDMKGDRSSYYRRYCPSEWDAEGETGCYMSDGDSAWLLDHWRPIESTSNNADYFTNKGSMKKPSKGK